MVDAAGSARAGHRIGNQRDWIVIARLTSQIRPRPSGSFGDQMSSVGRGLLGGLLSASSGDAYLVCSTYKSGHNGPGWA